MAEAQSASARLQKILETSRGKSYTVVIVTALLILVLVFFAILPAVNSILLQLTQNEVRQQALNDINKKRDTLRFLISKHNESLPVAVGLDESLPFDLDQEGMMNDLINHADKNGVSLYSVRFVNFDGRSAILRDISEVGLIDGVIINISVGGERATLRNFIDSMEKSRRVYSFNTASISRVDNRDDQFDFPFILNAQVEVFFWNVNKYSNF